MFFLAFIVVVLVILWMLWGPIPEPARIIVTVLLALVLIVAILQMMGAVPKALSLS